MLSYDHLESFLSKYLPGAFVIYPGHHDWSDAPDTLPIVHYQSNDDMPGEFQYGLTVLLDKKNDMPLISYVAAELSKAFQCSCLCDASHVINDPENRYGALLFKGGDCYLVDDRNLELNGQVDIIKKIGVDDSTIEPFFYP